MLERLIIRNFKQFSEVEIELGSAVVFVGPNNSGKTSALQALALWELGVRRWNEKRGKTLPKKRSGVTINRRDLVAIPVPETNLMWRDAHVRDSTRIEGKQQTENIRIDIEVRGVTAGEVWSCGLEFDYANQESLYCRPLGMATGQPLPEKPIPEAALGVRIAYLPPMSGLSANELRLDPGAVLVRLGEGRTAEVLRNLCYALYTREGEPNPWNNPWNDLVKRAKELFGYELEPPEYIPERGELTMSYRDLNDIRLDISAAGRGFQQMLLLLAYMLANPGSVLLLDEPDAHLEILRQRQIYNILTQVAQESGCQVIAASHSEVLLNEAADRDVVVAFVGKPHRIDDRGSQVLKALKSIGFEDYYLAETTGWVLYLEGATDLAILQAFAKILEHPVAKALERPFVHYIENQPQKAREHFYGVREAKQNLVGYILVDHMDKVLRDAPELRTKMWTRREIENYICFPEVLESFAERLASDDAHGPLFVASGEQRFRTVMRECIEDRIPPAAQRNRDDSWWTRVKASDEFLDLVFEEFFKKLGLPNLMRKTDYHRLADLVPREMLDPELIEVLDAIAEVAAQASPRAERAEAT